MPTSSPAVHALHEAHPVDVTVAPALTSRNRLTCAFRPILALPHLILVGGPVAFAMTWLGGSNGERFDWSAGGGVLGAVAVVIAIIAWFAIVFGARFPEQLWNLAAMYMRWRVRAVAYLALLRDEYPPFGEGDYPASLRHTPPAGDRDRLTVAFRVILVLPHLVVLWMLGFAWAIATVIAWFAILFTGNHPRVLFDFAVGVLRWSTRVEVYLLLLRDEYPPFTLDSEPL
jgi:hypothetical protein